MGYFPDTLEGINEFCASEGQPSETIQRLLDGARSEAYEFCTPEQHAKGETPVTDHP